MTLLKEFSFTWQINDKHKRFQFKLQTRCVTALYERLFPKFKNKDCWKVLLNCGDSITHEHYLNLLGVYQLDVMVDVESFLLLPDSEKKEWCIETLQAGINTLIEQTGWPPAPFLETYRKANELNLVNHWVWKKSVYSPSRKFVAEVLIEHEVQACDISIVVYDKDHQEISREILISEKPDEWAYARHLGTLTWESETEIVLTNKERSRTWHLNLSAP